MEKIKSELVDRFCVKYSLSLIDRLKFKVFRILFDTLFVDIKVNEKLYKIPLYLNNKKWASFKRVFIRRFDISAHYPEVHGKVLFIGRDSFYSMFQLLSKFNLLSVDILEENVELLSHLHQTKTSNSINVIENETSFAQIFDKDYKGYDFLRLDVAGIEHDIVKNYGCLKKSVGSLWFRQFSKPMV